MVSLQEYTRSYLLWGEYCWSLLSFALDRQQTRPLFCSTMAAVEVEFRQIEVAAYRHDTCIEQALKAPITAPFAEMVARDLVGGFGSTVWEGVHGQKLPLNSRSEVSFQ